MPLNRLIGVSILIAAWSTPSFGEEMGRITAYLDGVEKEWLTITTTRHGRTVATATFVQGPRIAEIHVHGHAEPRFAQQGVLSVEVRYLGVFTPEATPMSVDIIHTPKGLGGPFWTTRGAPDAPQVQIQAFDRLGRYGRLEAVFDAQLCLRRTISTATDPQNCRLISGLIKTELVAK